MNIQCIKRGVRTFFDTPPKNAGDEILRNLQQAVKKPMEEPGKMISAERLSELSEAGFHVEVLDLVNIALRKLSREPREVTYRYDEEMKTKFARAGEFIDLALSSAASLCVIRKTEGLGKLQSRTEELVGLICGEAEYYSQCQELAQIAIAAKIYTGNKHDVRTDEGRMSVDEIHNLVKNGLPASHPARCKALRVLREDLSSPTQAAATPGGLSELTGPARNV